MIYSIINLYFLITCQLKSEVIIIYNFKNKDSEFRYLIKLAKDLYVYEYVKDKISIEQTYDENQKIIIEEYKRRYDWYEK